MWMVAFLLRSQVPSSFAFFVGLPSVSVISATFSLEFLFRTFTPGVPDFFPYFNLIAEVSQMSSRLTSESRIYADKARDLNQQVSYQ